MSKGKSTGANRFSMAIDMPGDRAVALRMVENVKLGWRMELLEPVRSLSQNNIMWDALTDVSEQVEWHGQKYDPDEWKDFFMHALRRATWMPSEEGGYVPVGMRTSRLSVQEMADLLTVIQEFGARHGVAFKKLGASE